MRPAEPDTALNVLQSADAALLPTDELVRLCGTVIDALGADAGLDDVAWAMGAMHARPEVRLAFGRVAAERPTDPGARDLLSWQVNDVDDEVAVQALDAAARAGVVEALPDVFTAARRSLSALHGSVPPAGDRRQKSACRALDRLLARHPDRAAAIEELRWVGYDARQELATQHHDLTGMVEIPGDGRGAPPFHIDRFPVTVADYAGFVAAVDKHGPVWSHPGQPAEHDHDVLRGLSAEQRERYARHPVTGVSWFDAWAYASWAGKALPTAAQWERAAGTARFPWGDGEPSPRVAHYGREDRAGGEPRTVEVGSFPASATGLSDLAGNVWEWTRSRYLDGAELRPFIGGQAHGDTVGNWTLWACIKGGSWASGPDELAVGVRAAKHVNQRGAEVGFRCVTETIAE